MGEAFPLSLALKRTSGDVSTAEATLFDAAVARCLDSRAVVRFSLAGDGKLIDNLGTPTGSRVVQMYNGHAEISLHHKNLVTLSIESPAVEGAFLQIAHPASFIGIPQ